MKISPRAKKFVNFIKYPLTIALLILIFSNLDTGQLKIIISKMDISVISILLGVSLIKIFLQYANWENFLNLINDVNLNRKDKIVSFFAGISFRQISPGGVGVYGRIFLLSSSKKNSFLAITYEKFIQSWCLLFMGSLAAALFFNLLAGVWKFIIPASVFVLPFLLLLFSSKWYKNYFISYKKTLIPALILQLLINLFTVFQYYIFFSYFVRFTLLMSLKTTPLVQIGNLIPITVSGLGVREYLAVKVYPQLGVSGELAIACSLTVFAFSNLLPAFIGWVLLVLKKWLPGF